MFGVAVPQLTRTIGMVLFWSPSALVPLTCVNRLGKAEDDTKSWRNAQHWN